jgi:hydroxymethylbilane synthase
MKKRFKLATRGSALARVQSQWVADKIMNCWPEITVELVFIKTLGDVNLDSSLASLGGKGIFTKEIEQALLDEHVDFAVHSLKDLPSQLPEGLTLGATPVREDPRDALVGPLPIEELPDGASVGTGSLRRQVQLRTLRPQLAFEDIRGNVPTRIDKWRMGHFSGGVVLALAGLTRLGELAGAGIEEIHPLEVEQCMPAPCQGILGIECREGDEAALSLLAGLADPAAGWAATAERAFLRELGGGCNLPAGALAEVVDSRIRFRALLEVDGQLQRVDLQGSADEAADLGRRAADQLRK